MPHAHDAAAAAAQARQAAGDEMGARHVLTQAGALLTQRAAKLEDGTARARFLSLRDHARVRELCRQGAG